MFGVLKEILVLAIFASPFLPKVLGKKYPNSQEFNCENPPEGLQQKSITCGMSFRQ